MYLFHANKGQDTKLSLANFDNSRLWWYMQAVCISKWLYRMFIFTLCTTLL